MYLGMNLLFLISRLYHPLILCIFLVSICSLLYILFHGKHPLPASGNSFLHVFTLKDGWLSPESWWSFVHTSWTLGIDGSLSAPRRHSSTQHSLRLWHTDPDFSLLFLYCVICWPSRYFPLIITDFGFLQSSHPGWGHIMSCEWLIQHPASQDHRQQPQHRRISPPWHFNHSLDAMPGTCPHLDRSTSVLSTGVGLD